MIGILHTTESDPGSFDAVSRYFDRNPDIAPHLLIDPHVQQIRRITSAYDYAKALTNKPGGVETNRRDGGVFQVEIVGRAADCGGYSDEWYEWLGDKLYEISGFLGIAWGFRPTDAPRLTFDEWNDYALAGWFGHCHVPENDHTDPGTLDVARLKNQEHPMAGMTDDEMDRLAAKIAAALDARERVTHSYRDGRNYKTTARVMEEWRQEEIQQATLAAQGIAPKAQP